MLRTIRLIITADDLRQNYGDCFNCPAASALKRVIQGHVTVGGFGSFSVDFGRDFEIPNFNLTVVRKARLKGKPLIRYVEVDDKYLKPKTKRVRKSRALSDAQKLFNKVVRHLLKQNAKAVKCPGSSICLYRAPDGKRCAVGGPLPNRLYKPNMEEKSVPILFVLFPEVAEYFGKQHKALLVACQNIHDSQDIEVCEWPARLAGVAKEHGLKMPK